MEEVGDISPLAEPVNRPAESVRHIPLTISWNLTRRCDLACTHCYIDSSAETAGARELSAEESMRVLDQLAEVNPEAMLILTGGEPLLRPDLFELIEAANRKGFFPVLGSHGGLLDEATVDRLMGAGLKGAGVSIDSLDPGTHDRFRGCAGSWENAVDSLRVMRSRSLPFTIGMTVTDVNLHELEGMAAFAQREEATALNVFFMIPTGRGAGLKNMSAEECEEALSVLARMQAEYAGKLLINAKCAPHYRRVIWESDHASPFVRTFQGGGCPAGAFYCRVTPEGSVTPCPYMPLEVGNLRQESFRTIWDRASAFQELRRGCFSGRCGECEFRRMCGGCRCRAYAASGDYLAEDPLCVHRPGKYADEEVSLPTEATYGMSEAGELTWTAGARDRLKRIPFFARGMVSRAVERHAQAAGHQVVDEPLMQTLRERMQNRFPRGRT